MNGKEIYDMVRSISNMTERKQYLAKFTEEQKKLYTRYGNSLRQKKFNENPDKKTEYNRLRKDYIAEQRKTEPDLYKARNIKDIKAFREREKEKIDNKLKLVNTLTDAIRARKARKEMDALRKIKADKAKKREYMRRYRKEQKAKGGK
jgi:hypothetical protein